MAGSAATSQQHEGGRLSRVAASGARWRGVPPRKCTKCMTPSRVHRGRRSGGRYSGGRRSGGRRGGGKRSGGRRSGGKRSGGRRSGGRRSGGRRGGGATSAADRRTCRRAAYTLCESSRKAAPHARPHFRATLGAAPAIALRTLCAFRPANLRLTRTAAPSRHAGRSCQASAAVDPRQAQLVAAGGRPSHRRFPSLPDCGTLASDPAPSPTRSPKRC